QAAASEPLGQLAVVANRDLGSEFGSALEQIAQWVMHHGEEFLTASLRADERIRAEAVGTVVGLPLSCRGRRIGAVIGMDSDPSSRQPRLSAGVLRAIRMLLE